MFSSFVQLYWISLLCSKYFVRDCRLKNIVSDIQDKMFSFKTALYKNRLFHSTQEILMRFLLFSNNDTDQNWFQKRKICFQCTVRGGRSQMLFKLGVLKTYAIFKTQVLSWEYCEIFKNSFFIEHLQTVLLHGP